MSESRMFNDPHLLQQRLGERTKQKKLRKVVGEDDEDEEEAEEEIMVVIEDTPPGCQSYPCDSCWCSGTRAGLLAHHMAGDKDHKQISLVHGRTDCGHQKGVAERFHQLRGFIDVDTGPIRHALRKLNEMNECASALNECCHPPDIKNFNTGA